MQAAEQKRKWIDRMLASGGEMGELIRDFDWARTALGPIESWPESLLRAVSTMLPSKAQIILFWGPEFTVLYNDAYIPVTGEKHPGVLGTPGWVCWAEVWDGMLGPLLKGVISTGEAFWARDLLFIIKRSGFTEETYFDVSYDPVLDEEGDIGGVLCIVSETTQRVIGERRLNTLRNLAARTSEVLTVRAACEVAVETLVEDAADIPFALLYRLEDDRPVAILESRAGFEGDHPAAPEALPVDDAAGTTWPLGEALSSGKPRLVEQLDGRLGPLPGKPWGEPARSALVLPIRGRNHGQGQDAIYGFLVAGLNPRRSYDAQFETFLGLVAGHMATAIAGAQALEDERHRAEALAALNQVKTTFFSTISHEFRTPLTLLLNPLEDAMRASPGAPGAGGGPLTLDRETAQSMHHNTMRLLKLVNTLLDFSRLESGRMQAAFEPTDLSRLTAELASNFRSAMDSAGLALVIDCPTLPEPITLDREMWEKVVLNLLSNAFKFTRAGSITVRMRLVNESAVLEVRDTGIGIPRAEIPHIFERFYRVRTDAARTYEGTGIGLSLVEQLVKIHGGSIQVESELGVGTSIRVALPTGTAHLPAEQIRAARPPGDALVGADVYVMEAEGWLHANAGGDDEASPDAIRLPDMPPGRLLVVDDNADMRHYLGRLLNPYWQVETVADGAAALEAVGRSQPDLILTDVMMPRLDGFGLLKKLREEPATAHIPVIMLSARAGEAAATGGLAAGATDYLIKPFASRELLARVRTHLIAANAAAERREQSEIARRIVLADTVEAILEAVVGSSFLKDCILAGVFWYNTPWTDTQPDYGDILATWPEPAEPVDLTGLRFSFAEYGVAALSAPDRAVVIEDIRSGALAQPTRDILSALGSRCFITVPLIARGLCRGYLFGHWDHAHPFSADELRAIQQMVDIAAAELYNIVLLDSEARARKAAEKANEVKLRFIGMISHELRTPLTSIKGFTTTLLTPDLTFSSSDEHEFIRIIDDESDKLKNLIEQLLDVTRIQAGTLSVDLAPISIQEIFDVAMPELQTLTARHELRVRLPEKLPEVTADKFRVGQVLANLVSNAQKFAPAGSAITITAMQERGTVRIDVRDEGPGIPEDQQDAIFQPFTQLDGGADRSQAGVGLGLTIAQAIISAHGGMIWVEPQEIQGATIAFTLLVVREDWRERLK